MSRQSPADSRLDFMTGARPDRASGIAGLVGRYLAAARAEARSGRLAEAAERLLELRSRLVGRLPGEPPSPPRDGAPAALRPSPAGRREWLAAVQITAQAIADLNALCAGPDATAAAASRSADLDAWERRHRDRIGRWARQAPSVEHGLSAVPPEGSP